MKACTFWSMTFGAAVSLILDEFNNKRSNFNQQADKQSCSSKWRLIVIFFYTARWHQIHNTTLIVWRWRARNLDIIWFTLLNVTLKFTLRVWTGGLAGLRRPITQISLKDFTSLRHFHLHLDIKLEGNLFKSERLEFVVFSAATAQCLTYRSSFFVPLFNKTFCPNSLWWRPQHFVHYDWKYPQI